MDVRVQEAKVLEPKMRILLKDRYGKGLVPVDFTIDGISVPCKALEINLVAGAPGEIVLHISLLRCSVVLDVSKEESAE